MSTALVILAVVFLLVAVAAVVLSVRLSARGSSPAVAERQRRLRWRLAAPTALIGIVLGVLSRFVGS